MKDLIKIMIDESIEAKKCLYNQLDLLIQAAEIIYTRLSIGNKVLVFGNGGSAADSIHISGELVGRFKAERRALPVISLNTDPAILTSYPNDYRDGFKRLFERQVEALANSEDILWGISTSGKSENVIRAFNKGKEIGTYNFSLTGRNGGNLLHLSDLNINIPLNNTARIQEAHELAYHIICELIDNHF